MRVYKRLLLVLIAVLGAGVGFASPSKAVDSPVITMVVDCSRSTPTSSTEFGDLTASPGIYVVTVTGACSWAGAIFGSITVSTPCTTLLGPIPCVTVNVANLPGTACGTSLGAVLVETCLQTGVTPTTCTFTVTVNGTCLTAGTTGVIDHPGGAVTAKFEDSGHFDNTGYFIVTVRPAV